MVHGEGYVADHGKMHQGMQISIWTDGWIFSRMDSGIDSQAKWPTENDKQHIDDGFAEHIANRRSQTKWQGDSHRRTAILNS
jgi:hypothetical protein